MEFEGSLKKINVDLLDRWGQVDDGEWRPAARTGHSILATPRGMAVFGGERANGRCDALLYILDIGLSLPHSRYPPYPAKHPPSWKWLQVPCSFTWDADERALPRYSHASAFYPGIGSNGEGSALVIFGGLGEMGFPQRDLLVLDMDSMTWSRNEDVASVHFAPRPQAFSGGIGVATAGGIVFFGGRGLSEPNADVHFLARNCRNCQDTPPSTSGRKASPARGAAQEGEAHVQRNLAGSAVEWAWKQPSIQMFCMFDTIIRKSDRASAVVARPRYYHAACPLPDGQSILVMGGTDGFTLFSDVHVLSTKRWSWDEPSCCGAAPPPLKKHTLTLLPCAPEALVVLVGGETSEGSISSTIYLLEPSCWRWSHVPIVQRPQGHPKEFGMHSHGAAALPVTVTTHTSTRGLPPFSSSSSSSSGGARLLVFGGHFGCRGIPTCRKCLRNHSSPGCRGERDNSVYVLSVEQKHNQKAATLSSQPGPPVRPPCSHAALSASVGRGDEGVGAGGAEETLLFGCGMVCGQMRLAPWLMNPGRLNPLAKVKQVAAGGKHALLIDGAGAVWSWGANTAGQLGVEGSRALTEPTRIDVLYVMAGPACKVAAGFEHSLALMAQHRELFSFGCNSSFQLGLGHQHNQSSPQRITFPAARTVLVEDIAAGKCHSLASALQPMHAGLIFGDVQAGHEGGSESMRQIWCWGDNSRGQCGNGTRSKARAPELWGSHLYANVAVLLTRNRNDTRNAQRLRESVDKGPLLKMAAGENHSAVITTDGRVWVCGSNRRGQLGLGSGAGVEVGADGRRMVADEVIVDEVLVSVTCPQQVAGLEGLFAIDVGCCHNATCVVTCSPSEDKSRPSTYRVWSFGDNTHGALGLQDSTLALVAEPTEMVSLLSHAVRNVASGSSHALVVCAHGCAYAWGNNQCGQLGCDGGQGLILDAPQLVGGGDNPALSPFREWFVQASAGQDASYFLCTRGGFDLASQTPLAQK